MRRLTRGCRLATESLLKRVGTVIGASDWRVVIQAEVDGFAKLTLDHQWIQVDPDSAAKSVFEGAVVNGYLTLALAPSLMASIVKLRGFRFGLNYGLDRVRFPAPLRVGTTYGWCSTFTGSTRWPKVSKPIGGSLRDPGWRRARLRGVLDRTLHRLARITQEELDWLIARYRERAKIVEGAG